MSKKSPNALRKYVRCKRCINHNCLTVGELIARIKVILEAMVTMIRKVCILGGTGFVGRHLVSELTRRGYAARVLTRNRERHRSLLVLPTLELVQANIHHVDELRANLSGCDAVVNLVGILNEYRKPGNDFQSVHANLPEKIAQACSANSITRLLHMSALSADPAAPSEYLRSKARGEQSAHAAEIDVTSFRPSVIFGQDDDFFNRFANLLTAIPLIFPLACPNARFAPVYVEDVVLAFTNSLEDKSTYGQHYDLCGPREYTLKELVEYTAAVMGTHRRILGLNQRFSRWQARLLEIAPGKPFTRDNYLSMQVESTCRNNGLLRLGITPRSIDAIVPQYLGKQNKLAFYEKLRTSAGRE